MTAQLKILERVSRLGKRETVIIILVLLILNVMVGYLVYRMINVNGGYIGVVRLNQQQTVDGVSVKVNGLRQETSYVMNITPRQGKEIISLNLQIENNSSAAFRIFPSINTFIRDNEGQTYQLTLANIENPFETNSIEPGNTASGRLAYMVTSQNIPMKLYIENPNPNKPPFIIQLR